MQLIGGGATFAELTVEENLRMAAHAKLSGRAARAHRARARAFPMLRDRLGDRPRISSGGQQQMLALAMALIHDPEVLIIDELSLGLAPIVVQQVLEVVRTLKEAQGSGR